ncbi:AAA family ATPase [bacterium (Candidatus Howlettbacteria) CG_4_10_14_0_8_um_filter_40_9]|nr:MAG: AAA family ATPase [bacterium (Candidatus Howlettbacteria) CG_4_10_14_0_8_um_filter_40_9]
MKIPRFYTNLAPLIKPNKVLVIYGSRRAGKTTLLREYLGGINGKMQYKLDSGDNIVVQETLSSRNFSKIKNYARGYDLIAIDEAQKIPKIGEALKIMVDEIPDIKIIATGSSSFELSGQIGEPLTGRKRTITLYPISQIEMLELSNAYEIKNDLDKYLIYGGYPEVIANKNPDEKKEVLEELLGSYLLKDILELEKVKGSKILLDLLRLLAFQVGSEVSLPELGRQLGLDYKTVARYLDLFEKSFIVYNLRGFSRNLRKEVTKKSKYYFFDNGIRNAIIANFNPLETRDDIGKLWENFLVSERIKKRSYKSIYANAYFWRTYSGQEIDLIEEREGTLFGYEFKWSPRKPTKAPKDWVSAYPKAEYSVITKENYLEFLT